MREYLWQRASPREPFFAVLLIALYMVFGATGGYGMHAPLLLLLAIISTFAGAPRGVVYGLIFLSFTCTIADDIFIAAVGGQDGGSDRDDAVELGCKALLRGQNPWAITTQLRNAISTGPTSFLIAMPFVWIFGRINEMTFFFWLALGAAAFYGDVLRRNGTFMLVVPVMQLGLMDLHTTRYWSLDELAFATLFFLGAWALVERKRYLITGLCLGQTLMCRASYLFPVIAFVCWLRWGKTVHLRQLLTTLCGICLSVATVAGFFAIRFHATIRAANPLAIAVYKANWALPRGNELTNALTAILNVPPAVMPAARALLAIALILCLARVAARARASNPLTYVALGNLLGFTVVHYAGKFADNFSAPIVLPALLALSFASIEAAPVMSARVPT